MGCSHPAYSVVLHREIALCFDLSQCLPLNISLLKVSIQLHKLFKMSAIHDIDNITIMHNLLWSFPSGSWYLTYIFKPPLSKKPIISSPIITLRSHWILSSRWLTTLQVKQELPLLPNPSTCYMYHCSFTYLEFSVPCYSPITAPQCWFWPILPLLAWIPSYLHTPPHAMTTDQDCS